VTKFLERRRSSVKDREGRFLVIREHEGTDRKRGGGGAILVERGKKLSSLVEG
jgi:hypothetical protein